MTTATRVIALIVPLVRIGIPASVTPTAQLHRDLFLDSLDRQSLAVELDVAFGIEVPAPPCPTGAPSST